MPNWCENNLYINGPTEDLIRFKEKAKGDKDSHTDLCMNNFIPRPAEEEENWYEWNNNHWGCKWDIKADIAEVDLNTNLNISGYIKYEFDSPWSPPAEFIKQVAKKYPSLRFDLHYEEPGMDFAGDIFVQGDNFTNYDCPPSTQEDSEDLDRDPFPETPMPKIKEKKPKKVINKLIGD